ncbi:MAG: TlpA family protein disulfide reductase [Marmoricola sp.]
MSSGAWVVIVAVVLAVAFGAYRALTDGHFRGTHKLRGVEEAEEQPTASVLTGTPWADRLGERATFVQFSSAFCAPCRATRRILTDIAAAEDGIAHVEVDAEQHLDLVRRTGITRTPTTLVLDAAGVEVTRAVGAPTRDQVARAVSAIG